jgi:hypothetical protein
VAINGGFDRGKSIRNVSHYSEFIVDVIFLHSLPCSKKFIDIILGSIALNRNLGSAIDRFIIAFYLRKKSYPHACPIVHQLFIEFTFTHIRC